MRRTSTPLSCCLLVGLALLAAGCVESSWVIPYPASKPQSKLWASDPRTRGWDGVTVTYDLLTDGHVDAHVRSTDGRHHFKARGECWYETREGEKSTSFLGENSTPVLVVRFDEREERYLDGGVNSRDARALVLLESSDKATAK